MAICVIVVDGFIKSTSTSIGSCTDYVLQSASDFAMSNPVVSYDDVQLMAWGVVAVWALAWSVKVLRRAL